MFAKVVFFFTLSPQTLISTCWNISQNNSFLSTISETLPGFYFLDYQVKCTYYSPFHKLKNFHILIFPDLTILLVMETLFRVFQIKSLCVFNKFSIWLCFYHLIQYILSFHLPFSLSHLMACCSQPRYYSLDGKKTAFFIFFKHLIRSLFFLHRGKKVSVCNSSHPKADV